MNINYLDENVVSDYEKVEKFYSILNDILGNHPNTTNDQDDMLLSVSEEEIVLTFNVKVLEDLYVMTEKDFPTSDILSAETLSKDDYLILLDIINQVVEDNTPV